MAVVGEVITERDVVVYIGRGNLEEDPAEIYPDASAEELERLRFEAALSGHRRAPRRSAAATSASSPS